MKGWIDVYMYVCMYGWKDGWMNRWMDGCYLNRIIGIMEMD